MAPAVADKLGDQLFRKTIWADYRASPLYEDGDGGGEEGGEGRMVLTVFIDWRLETVPCY